MGNQLTARPMVPWEARSSARLSLILRPGQRPSAAEIVQLSQSGQVPGRPVPANETVRPGFAVSYQPGPNAGWVELLASGLTFELGGLAPAMALPMPAIEHFYGISEESVARAEAITLVPGEQLHGAENLLPVLRVMAGLAARLAELARVWAVVWHPARCAIAPGLFVSLIDNWLNGGPFPVSGLTALYFDGDGTFRSEGLAFFIGQELQINPILGKNTAYYAKIATRLINQLVGSGPIHQPLDFIGPSGEHLCVEPSGNGGFLKVWRKT